MKSRIDRLSIRLHWMVHSPFFGMLELDVSVNRFVNILRNRRAFCHQLGRSSMPLSFWEMTTRDADRGLSRSDVYSCLTRSNTRVEGYGLIAAQLVVKTKKKNRDATRELVCYAKPRRLTDISGGV